MTHVHGNLFALLNIVAGVFPAEAAITGIDEQMSFLLSPRGHADACWGSRGVASMIAAVTRPGVASTKLKTLAAYKTLHVYQHTGNRL